METYLRRSTEKLFGYRIVFGFFEGEFTLEELERFMGDLAESLGIALIADRYFKMFNADFRVKNTGGISLQKTMCLPDNIEDIMDEFNDFKFIDEATYHSIETSWFGFLRAMQAVRFLEKEL